MNETAPMTAQDTFNLALEVATKLHKEMLNDAFTFPGYEGDRDAFLTLLAEVDAIAGDSCLIHPDLLDVENLYSAWYDVQIAIGYGEMEADWYRH